MVPAQRAKTTARIALTGTLVLMLLQVILNVSGPAPNLIVLVFLLVPLALTLHGQIRGKARSYQWLCFVILFFLTQGIVLAFTPGSRIMGMLETSICLVVFFSAIIFIRSGIRNPARTSIRAPDEPEPTSHD